MGLICPLGLNLFLNASARLTYPPELSPDSMPSEVTYYANLEIFYQTQTFHPSLPTTTFSTDFQNTIHRNPIVRYTLILTKI